MDDTQGDALQPILIIVLATAASVPLGLALRRNLATLSYRNDDEPDLPDPGPRWWVAWVSVLATGSLATAAALDHSSLAYLPLVPLATTGPWLAAVDLDVLRIPNRVLTPTAVATLLAVVLMTAAAQDLRILVVPVVGGLLAGGVFTVVHFATNGGIGFGDVKLAGLLAIAIGPLGADAVWAAVLTGSVGTLVWARSTQQTGPVPCGPGLLAGAYATLASFIGGSAISLISAR